MSRFHEEEITCPQCGKTSRVVMISKEGLLPYSRVLLPYVLRGKLPYDGMTIRTQEMPNSRCMSWAE